MAPSWDELHVGLKKQIAPPVVHADLTGKTVIVTGANIGLGFEACKHFAKMNAARVILACRSIDKGSTALAQLKAETGYSGGEVWQVDFSSFASVSAFADRADRELDRLDILVENAATAIWGPFEFTEDGWETCLEANCLGQELLAFRLLPLLKRTAEQHSGTPRLVIVTSGLLFMVDIPELILDEPKILEALNKPELCTPKPKENSAQDPNAFGNVDRYSHTKLLNLFFTRSLQSHVGSSIIVDCVNPGFCISNLRSNIPDFMKEGNAKQEAETAFTTEEGSRQLVYGAVGGADNEQELRGAYISRSKVEEVSSGR
ncbi:NAD(P)-binding protein [Hymenopellis radicata]|nr:NAD(P)-binding protein [Hymenopellis radicata]